MRDITFDVETTGLTFESEVVLGGAYSEGRYYPDPGYIPLLNSNTPKFAHRAEFDLLMLNKSGVHVGGKIYDTKKMAWVLGEVDTGLPYLIEKYLDKEYESFHKRMTTEELREHNKECVEYTHRLSKFLTKQVVERGVQSQCNFQFNLIPVVVKMEIRGFPMDHDGLVGFSKDIQGKRDKLREQFRERYGDANPNSPVQLAKLLFEERGLPIMKRSSKTGNPSTDEEALRILSLRHTDQAMTDLLEYRHYEKIHKTYCEGFMGRLNKDGKIHARFNPLGAGRTGRMSSTGPNLQNVPKTSFRKLFTASEDNVLLVVDYNQIELRLAAYFSGDRALINFINGGGDLHHDAAVDIFGDKNRRVEAKRVNFGILYGLTPTGLGKDLSINPYTARMIINAFNIRNYNLTRWRDNFTTRSLEDGYVTTLSGTKIPVISRNQPVNYKIQGSAADVIKKAMVEFNDNLICQVHDELIFDVPKKEAKFYKNKVCEVMENVYDIDPPLKVEAKIVNNWGEAN
jgi:DNA polymerase I